MTDELHARIRTLELELAEARKRAREAHALAGLHAIARHRAEARERDAIRDAVRTVLAWMSQATHLRVQVGRMVIGELVIRAVRDELARYVDARLRASEEDTLRVLPESGD